MAIRSEDLEAFSDTLDGFCGACMGDLKYVGDLGMVSVFWCVECGTEHSVMFGGER